MSTPSKNNVLEEDDDDQDYIPVGILQLSSVGQAVSLGISPTPPPSDDVGLRTVYSPKPSALPQTLNLPQLEQLKGFEEGQGRGKNDVLRNQVWSEPTERGNFFQNSKKDQCTILLQLMQQRAQAEGNSSQVNQFSTRQQQGKTVVSVQNQKIPREDLNSNVPQESKKQLLKILASGKKDDQYLPHVPHLGHILPCAGHKQELNYRVHGGSNDIRTNDWQGHSELLKHIEAAHTESKAQQISSSSALSIDISSSSHHIPKSVEQFLQQSPTSISASDLHSHHFLNNQHPEISKRLNSPVSSGRQSTSPRQAISPRHAGSPRHVSSSPCQFVSPKQPVSPRGTSWKSQPSSPQSFHSPSSKVQTGFSWQPPSPSSQMVSTRKLFAGNSTQDTVSNVTSPFSIPSCSPTSQSFIATTENIHNHPSRFQPVTCSSRQRSLSGGGIVHHRPILELSNQLIISNLSGPAFQEASFISGTSSLPQPSPVFMQHIDSTACSKQVICDSERKLSKGKVENLNLSSSTVNSTSSHGSSVANGNKHTMPNDKDNSIVVEHLKHSTPSEDKGQSNVMQKLKHDCDNESLVKAFQTQQSNDESKLLADGISEKKLRVKDNQDMKSQGNECDKSTVDTSNKMTNDPDVKKQTEVEVSKEEQEKVKMKEGGVKKLSKSDNQSTKQNETIERLRSKKGSNKSTVSNDDQGVSQSNISISDNEQKAKESECSKSVVREAFSKRQRKPKVPFEDSSTLSGKEKKREKSDVKTQQFRSDIIENRNVEKAKRRSSSLEQSVLTRSSMQHKGQINRPQAKLSVYYTRSQLISRSKRMSDVKRNNRHIVSKRENLRRMSEKEQRKEDEGHIQLKNNNDIHKESDKGKQKVSFNEKEPNKDIKKANESAIESEKGPKGSSDNSSKDSEVGTRSSSRLLARQTTSTVDKNKITTPTGLKVKNDETPKAATSSQDERVSTRSSKPVVESPSLSQDERVSTRSSKPVTESPSLSQDGVSTRSSKSVTDSPYLSQDDKVSTRSSKFVADSSSLPGKSLTRGMTTRQIDGSRNPHKRPVEFIESLSFPSRKLTKSSDGVSKENSTAKNDLKVSDVRSTRSKTGSLKKMIEIDEDEYDIDEDEEDSADESVSPSVTRPRRITSLPRRKLSMRLRGEVRKRKYLADESASDDSSDDEKTSASDEDMSKSHSNVKIPKSDHCLGESKSSKASVLSESENKTLQTSGQQMEEKEDIDSSPILEKSEESRVGVDPSKLVAFKLVPLSPEEIAGNADSASMIPLSGFVIQGTNHFFLSPDCTQHLEKTDIISTTNLSRSAPVITQQSHPMCTRVLVTPKPILSVTDSCMKTSAFTSPSKHLSLGYHSEMKNQSSVPSAPTPPPAVSLSSMSSAKTSSSLPWNSPSLPTPPPSVSSTSSHSSSSWNHVANLSWMPEVSSNWNSGDLSSNEGWRHNGYVARTSFADNISTDLQSVSVARSQRLQQGIMCSAQDNLFNSTDSRNLSVDPTDSDPSHLLRDASNLSPSSYNIALPGLGQQDISFLESKLDISSGMLLSDVSYDEGIHESVSVHHDNGNLVCSVNLDVADVGGLGSNAPTLHLPETGLDPVAFRPLPRRSQQEAGMLALRDERSVSVEERMQSSCGLKDEDTSKPMTAPGITKVGEKSLTNTRRHLYEICMLDGKKMGKCNICSNSYSLTSIYRHLKKHDNPNYGFHCSVCGKKYSQKHHLSVHLKKVHSLEASAELDLDGLKDEDFPESSQTKGGEEGSLSHRLITNTEGQIQPTENVDGKESKKKSRKRSMDRKFVKDGLVYEQMPESPNPISMEIKKETHRQVRRFRRMKARKKLAAGKNINGISMDLSLLDENSSSSDDEEVKMKVNTGNDNDSGGYGVKFGEQLMAYNTKVKKDEEMRKNGGNKTSVESWGNLGSEGNSDSSTSNIATSLPMLVPEAEIKQSVKEFDGCEKPHFDKDKIPDVKGINPDIGGNNITVLLDGNDGTVLNKQDENSLVQTVEGQKERHPCSLCKSVLSSKCSYVMHMRRHNMEKNKFCSYCGKTFFTAQEVRSHERTHTGERPYTCEICNCSFAHCGSFQAHKRGHIKRGETVPFPPDKCYREGQFPQRKRKNAPQDKVENQEVNSEGETSHSTPNTPTGNVTDEKINFAGGSVNSEVFRRRSLDSNFDSLVAGEMGPPWSMSNSDDISWSNKPFPDQTTRRIVPLETKLVQDCSFQSQRPPAANFRDQTSPPFYSPTHYSQMESPMASPSSHRNQVMSPGPPQNQTYQSSSNTNRFPSPSQQFPQSNVGQSSTPEQTFSPGNHEGGRFASPGIQPTSFPQPSMNPSPSQQHMTPSGYTPSQQFMYQPPNSSPSYSQPAQQLNTPHAMQRPSHPIVGQQIVPQQGIQNTSQRGMQTQFNASFPSMQGQHNPLNGQHNTPQQGMHGQNNTQGMSIMQGQHSTSQHTTQGKSNVNKLLTNYIPSAPFTETHQMEYQQTSHHSFAPIPTPSSNTLQSSVQQHPQTIQLPTHYPQGVQQFQHRQPSHQLQPQQLQQRNPSQNLQQLLTQPTQPRPPPPPPYTANKPKPPPPYPSNNPYNNEFYRSPQLHNESQMPRMQSPSVHTTHHNFTTPYTNPSIPAQFRSGSGTSPQPTPLSAIRLTQSASSNNRPTLTTNTAFNQSMRSPGQMGSPAHSSNSTKQPYHQPSPSISSPNSGYFHQGPSPSSSL